jgi:hypothetical protein
VFCLLALVVIWYYQLLVFLRANVIECIAAGDDGIVGGSVARDRHWKTARFGKSIFHDRGVSALFAKFGN